MNSKTFLKYFRKFNNIKCGHQQQLRFLSETSSIINTQWRPPDNGYDTGIQVNNCVARQKVPLIFRNQNCVTWYTCGPTVYDSAHVGHASCYVKLDIIQRILRHHFNINLITAMNITDIDDKIILRSNIENTPWQQLTQKYEQEFWTEMDLLGIQRPDIVLRVSQFIPEIIEFVQSLIENKSAYIGGDGSVYFENKQTEGKLQNYGTPQQDDPKLQKILEIKKSLTDFALWKASKPGEPSWNVPWRCENKNINTAGRPGWHTECSAMASKIFGKSIDIHAGGIDLRFPHHENEEAQCCAYYNAKYWVNYWLHVGHLLARDDTKMSKSLKNTISIRELLSNYTRDQFRIACLLSDYRYPMELNEQHMTAACSTLKKFASFLDDTKTFINTKELQNIQFDRNQIEQELNSTVEKIDKSLKDDFRTTYCITHLSELVTFVNKILNTTVPNTTHTKENTSTVDVIQAVQNVVKYYLWLFGCSDTLLSVSSDSQRATDSGAADISNLINAILSVRTNVRQMAIETKDNRLFDICNNLRTAFTDNGIEIKDHGSKGAPSTWAYNLNFNVDKDKKQQPDGTSKSKKK